MRASSAIRCHNFPCKDVRHECFRVPGIEMKPEKVRAVMVSEAVPAAARDFYYAGDESIFDQTTVQAFKDAGVEVSNAHDILRQGVYLTTAVKCGKTGYAIQTGTIKECSRLLEKELALFPNVKVLLLMGDVAIKALNEIARRAGEPRAIPAGSTYKLRGQKFQYRGMRVFPSYLQAGRAFFIEKSKRKMIAQDIASAMRVLRKP